MIHNLRYLKWFPTGVGYFLGLEKHWGRPLFFGIETVNTCNFRCVYCPQSEPDSHFVNGRGVMTFERFKTVLDNLHRSFKLEIISLHRDGEPLLNRGLEKCVAYATSLGIHVSFSTNGSLITEKRAEGLLDAGLRMVNTDFCADVETYETLRAGGKWAETFQGLETLLNAAERKGSDLRVIIKDLGTHDLPPERTHELLGRTAAHFSAWPGRVRVIPIHFHNALGQSLQNLAPPTGSVDLGYNLCHQPWVSMTVDWAGRVVGCCRDLRSEFVLGNLLEQEARDVWNGPEMRRMRRALKEKKPEDIAICRNCDVPWQGSYSGRGPLDRAFNFFFSSTWRRD